MVQVTLSPGTVFAAAQELNTKYLHYLEPDRLLYQFNQVAGLPTTAEPYGGWESPTYVNGLINGHFTGHLLSATAFSIASHVDPTGLLKNRSIYLVQQLRRCQQAYAAKHPADAGYLSAYGIDQIERLEAHNSTHVWAPYYTLHKIMAGQC